MPHPVIYQHAELDGTSFYWKKGEPAVLCLHGFTATTVEVRSIAAIFRSKGLSTSGPLLPGHGTTPEDLNTKNWKDWVNSAEEAYLQLRKNHHPIFILGESLGGLLSLHLAAKYPDIAGVVLCAPALIIPRLWISKIAKFFKGYIYKSNTDDSMPWQGYNVVPLKAAASLFDFQRQVRSELHSVNSPVIIFQGSKDKTIDPMSSFAVYQHIGSQDKELIWLPDSSHVILLDEQLPDVESMSFEFIQRILIRTVQ